MVAQQIRLIKNLIESDIPPSVILQLVAQQLSHVKYKKVLASLSGSVIVALSSLIKVPQIKKIVSHDTLDEKITVAEGLSLQSINLELFSQLVHSSYGLNNGFKFNSYGETVFLSAQNLVIKFLIKYYKLRATLGNFEMKDSEKIHQALVGLVTPILLNLLGILLILKAIPKRTLAALELACIPISVISKIPQIIRNHEIQSTSQLSGITIGAGVIGSLLRIFTSVQNKQGSIIISGYTSSFIMNSILAFQIFRYKDLKKLSDEKKKQE